MDKLLAVTLILLSLLALTLPVKAQNPFTSKDSSSQISRSYRPMYPFLAKIAAWQQQLNQRMAALIRQAKEKKSIRPILFLIIIAFVYGILHAAGPGHGKSVAVSYMISRDRKLTEGIILGNTIAFFHGISGTGLVLAVYFVIHKGVAHSLESLTYTTKLISYSLIALVGAGLLVRSLISCRRRTKIQRSDHAEHSKKKQIKPLAMGMIVGMIPCPAVVLVMLFCLSMNMIGLGLLLVFFLTIGMSLTITAVGVTGLAAKNLALGMMERRHKLAEIIAHCIEIAASLMVIATGLLLLGATVM